MRFPLVKGCYRCAWHTKGGRFLCRWSFGLWDVSAAEEAVRRLRARGRLRVVRISWLTLRRLALRDGWFGGGSSTSRTSRTSTPARPASSAP